MTLRTCDVEMMTDEQRAHLAQRLLKISDDSPTPRPCTCTDSDLRVWHQFGAMVICAGCGTRGRFIPGNNYQQEEANAVWAWNGKPRIK